MGNQLNTLKENPKYYKIRSSFIENYQQIRYDTLRYIFSKKVIRNQVTAKFIIAFPFVLYFYKVQIPDLEVNARYAMEKKLRKKFDSNFEYLKPEFTEEEYYMYANRQKYRNYG